MTEPTEIKRKAGRPPKVENVVETPMTTPAIAMAGIVKLMINQIADLRSRIEAIELFRNPGAIEKRLQEMGAQLDELSNKK